MALPCPGARAGVSCREIIPRRSCPWTTPSIPCNANWNRNGGTLACLCAGFALPHGHGDEADNARDEMAELLAWSHANLCAARIRALEGLLGDLRCSGRRLCMDCGEEIPLSRLLAVPCPKDLPQGAGRSGGFLPAFSLARRP